jgi:hypothetical protein
VAHNFKLGLKEEVGHLLKWSFPNAGKDLEAKTKVPTPTAPETPADVIGVFSYIGWKGAPNDPIEFTLVIDPKNGGDMQTALASFKGGREVDLEFIIYRYDTAVKEYIKRYHSDGKALKCQITKGTKLKVTPFALAGLNEGYQVTGSLSPKDGLSEEQTVTLEFTQGSPFPLPFGVVDA